MAANKKTGGKMVCESGVIEGFFGPPWTYTARRGMIEFMASAGFDTYIYAPKEDPFHRTLWNKPYPEDEWLILEQSVKTCVKNGIDFAYAISPGLGIRYASDDDFDALFAKIEKVAGLGVRTFGLFLDDIPPELAHAVDKKKFRTLAAAHVHIANRLRAQLPRLHRDARLWFCPTEYCGTKPSPYLETIGAGMSPDIGIFWTGPEVVSPGVSAANVKPIASALRRKPILWDNYPVNDYNRHKINLGPLRGRGPGLPRMLAGYFANPMNEAYASRIPLLTAAAYLKDPKNYDPDAEQQKAVEKVVGKKWASGIATLCDAWPANFFENEPPTQLVNDIKAAQQGRPAALKRRLEKLATLRAKITFEPALQDLVADIRPYLKETSFYAEAALTALKAPATPNPESQKTIRKALNKAETSEMNATRKLLRAIVFEKLNPHTAHPKINALGPGEV